MSDSFEKIAEDALMDEYDYCEEFDLDELDFDFEGFGFDSGFDAIQDLLDDDLVSFKDEFEKSSFNVTFTFPADKKQSVKAFLDDAGKDQAVSIIVKAAEQWE